MLTTSADRRERYAEALYNTLEHSPFHQPWNTLGPLRRTVWYQRADAAIKLADAELQQERERLFDPLHRAEAENARLRATQTLADRAAVLREAADAIDATFTGPGLDRYTRYGADLLRRMADETPAADMRAWQQEWNSRPNGADVSDLIEITPAARVVPCGGTFHSKHQPHNWEPQPGMDPVHCPGARQDGEQP